MEKFATLLTTSVRDLAAPEGVEEPLPLGDRRLALEDRRVEPLAELVELVEVLADDERRLAARAGATSASTTLDLLLAPVEQSR